MVRRVAIAVLSTFWLLATAIPGQADRELRLPKDTKNVRHFKLRSERLSKFWGRDMFIEAGVVLPDDDEKDPLQLPVCYSIHGFGGSCAEAWVRSRSLLPAMREQSYPRLLYVFLQAHFSLGHHTFADSVNNGPWGTALVEEFIPALEKKFGAAGKAHARFLTGHSSGGWASLWLQVNYPEVFGGVWSTAPDSVDFRDFTGIDIYSYESAYVDPDEFPIQLVRRGKDWRMSVQEFVRAEQARGSLGGQFQSFDAVFGPRGPDGRPMPLFERSSGEIDKTVAKAWQNYDISRILQQRWPKEAATLAPKLHIYMGTLDTFRLEGALYRMRDALRKIGGPQPTIVFAKDRNHGDLARAHEHWPRGLLALIHAAMRERFDKAEPKDR